MIDDQVQVAVAVEVAEARRRRPAVDEADAGPGGDVLERAVAPIAVEDRPRPGR